ncbi:hypothetical protein F4827_003513 [Paraburkholderia bannensis]|uniref:Uncharacterized protein n=1 Tax=Paraburkholderia bannensis TaxID=765414 RepID=A0A7W9TYC4_9BURK|nr:hypothetical protein [Paraburkholderia bannensis]MBB6103658.1 hypothetical protein [Paraburkholderia bannensis]
MQDETQRRNQPKPLQIGESGRIVFVLEAFQRRGDQYGMAPKAQRFAYPRALRAREVSTPRPERRYRGAIPGLSA